MSHQSEAAAAGSSPVRHTRLQALLAAACLIAALMYAIQAGTAMEKHHRRGIVLTKSRSNKDARTVDEQAVCMWRFTRNSSSSDGDAQDAASWPHPLHGQAMQARGASSNIPRIIHQNFMSGEQQLLAEAQKEKSHFRKEWWISCKRHHPDWVHMLWDEATCRALLEHSYPWFLETYKNITTLVLRSDAMRPFILHAYGGVYLDLDTECFANMEPWVMGPQVVLSAEGTNRANNAQMAGVAAHPLWEKYQKVIQVNLQAGVTFPVAATGPVALTGVIQAVLPQPISSARDFTGAHQLADGTWMVIYAFKQWFTACTYDDANCTVSLAYDKLWMHSRATAQVSAAKAASSQPSNAASGIPLMVNKNALAGAHHFSGSWTGWSGIEDKSNQSIKKGGLQGAAAFLNDSGSFVEQPCKEPRLLGSSMPVCWEIVATDAAENRCIVYLVHTVSEGSNGLVVHDMAAGQELADAGCEVHLVSNQRAKPPEGMGLRHTGQRRHEAATHHTITRSQALKPFDGHVDLTQHSKITLLHLAYDDATPGAPSVIDVLYNMYLGEQAVLGKVHMLSLEMPSPSQADLAKAYAALQHIYQEVGLLGSFHKKTRTAVGDSYQLGFQRDPRLLQPC